MEGLPSQSCSASSVGSDKKMRVCLCGMPAVTKTSWTNKNFGRRYSKCANKGCAYFDYVEPPTNEQSDRYAGGDKISTLQAEMKLKEKEDELELKEREAKLLKERMEEEMLQNMQKLLKEAHKREENYWKLLILTWVIMGCIFIMLLKRV